jgi:hypothetical protein
VKPTAIAFSILAALLIVVATACSLTAIWAVGVEPTAQWNATGNLFGMLGVCATVVATLLWVTYGVSRDY